MAGQKKLWEMEPEELTDLIDPSLKFIRRFDPPGYAYVHLVESEHGLSVLKIEREYIPHILPEKKALKALESVKGIPKLYEDYTGKRYQNAILKEYIDGEEIGEFLISEELELQKKVKKLFDDMVKRKVVIVDPHDKNIIVNKSKQPYMIDLGLAEFENDGRFHSTLNYFYTKGRESFFPDIK